MGSVVWPRKKQQETNPGSFVVLNCPMNQGGIESYDFSYMKSSLVHQSASPDCKSCFRLRSPKGRHLFGGSFVPLEMETKATRT